MPVPPCPTIDSKTPVPVLGGVVDECFGTFPMSYVTFNLPVRTTNQATDTGNRWNNVVQSSGWDIPHTVPPRNV